jgi:hypothetical protein
MPKPLSLALLFAAALPAAAADLQQKTAAAFDHYVAVTEKQMSGAGRPFLHVDGMPEAQRAEALKSLQKGEYVIASLKTQDGKKDIDIDDGLVHHWVGVVFVPGGTVDQAVALLQDYNRHEEIYKPNVQRSKLLERDGDRFKVYLRFYMKQVLTVVVNSDHEARFTREGPDRASSRIRSTRIAEVENPGTKEEREKPVGRDGGYLWRLNSYWKFLQRDGGVYVQCESISLSRDLPFLIGPLIKPFVTSVPRESLEFTLETTRKELMKPPVKPRA